MKVLRKITEKEGGASVLMRCMDSEDIWALHNLISPGDVVVARDRRRVKRETAFATSSELVTVKIVLKVEKTEYDGASSTLRVSGTSLAMSKFMKQSEHHTFEFGLEEDCCELELRKRVWSGWNWQTLAAAESDLQKAAAIILLVDRGRAALLAHSATLTRTVGRVELPVPKRRLATAAAAAKALSGFNAAVLRMLRTTLVDSGYLVKGNVAAFVIAGPNTEAETTLAWLKEELARAPCRELDSLIAKALAAKTSTAHPRAAVAELLDAPAIAAALGEIGGRETQAAMAEFQRLLAVNPGLVCYGGRHVRLAVARGAVKLLLVSDGFMRPTGAAARAAGEALADAARAAGADVRVASEAHAEGTQLARIGGVAALLRFPVPELEELD